MTEYAVLGVGRTTEYKLLSYSEKLKQTDAYEMIRKMGMIMLPENKIPPALIVMPVGNTVIVGEVSSINDNPIEARPHTCVHYFVMDNDMFVQEMKDVLADSQVDEMFVHSNMIGIKEMEREGKLVYTKPISADIATSAYYDALQEEQKWNLFLNLVEIVRDNRNVAIHVPDKSYARILQSDFYKILPKSYAINLSSLTYGRCKAKFNVLFTMNDSVAMYENTRIESLCEFGRRDGEEEYSNLKMLVTGTDEDRYDFFASPFMAGYEKMSLDEMEQAAFNYLMWDGKTWEEETEEEFYEEVSADDYEEDYIDYEEDSNDDDTDDYDEVDYVEIFKTQLKEGELELDKVVYLRRVLEYAYAIYGALEVRAALRERLRCIYMNYMKQRSFISRLYISERERLFVQMLLLTCEMTTEEEEYYYSRNPHFVKKAPYFFSQFDEFVKLKFNKKMGRRIRKICKEFI